MPVVPVGGIAAGAPPTSIVRKGFIPGPVAGAVGLIRRGDRGTETPGGEVALVGGVIAVANGLRPGTDDAEAPGGSGFGLSGSLVGDLEGDEARIGGAE